jgi:RNA recognition motif-containing protein
MLGIPRPEEVSVTQPTVETNAVQKIHIGNLAAASSEAGVRELFAAHGTVSSYERPLNKTTQEPGAFAYVEMAHADAAKAIEAVNGTELDGQALRVSEARPPRA